MRFTSAGTAFDRGPNEWIWHRDFGYSHALAISRENLDPNSAVICWHSLLAPVRLGSKISRCKYHVCRKDVIVKSWYLPPTRVVTVTVPIPGRPRRRLSAAAVTVKSRIPMAVGAAAGQRPWWRPAWAGHGQPGDQRAGSVRSVCRSHRGTVTTSDCPPRRRSGP
jgi:hypothetical protein